MVHELFSLANMCALLGWLPLIFRPGSPGGKRFASTILSVLCCGYATTVAVYYFQGGAFPTSLSGLKALLETSSGMLAMWLHYLAMDLAAGLWISRKALQIGLGRKILASCLVLTLLQGPAGVLLFLIVLRARHGKTLPRRPKVL